MKAKKSKSRTIIEAFARDTSELGDWYQQRVDTCNACEDLFKLTRQCKICLCFVDKKASDKQSACGREELSEQKQLDKPLKWNRMLLETFETERFDIENLNPEIVNISINEDDFILDFAKKSIKEQITVQIKLINDNEYKIIDTGSSCVCTDPSYKDGILTVKYKPKRGKQTQWVNVTYKIKDKQIKQKFILKSFGV